MSWPWVSRDLYERTLADLKKSERRRKALLKKLRAIPVSAEALADELTRRAEEDPEKFIPASMTPETPSGLRKMAQHAANVKAGRVA